MPKPSRIWKAALTLPLAVWLASCANAPKLPAVTQCPPWPQVPPALMEKPKASQALIRLESALSDSPETVSPTPSP